MKILSVFIFSVVLFCMSNPSEAYDDNGECSVRGVGASTCGEYIKGKFPKELYHQWMLGYISGINKYEYGYYDFSQKMEYDILVVGVESYCKSNPIGDFTDAIHSLLKETIKKHPKPKR